MHLVAQGDHAHHAVFIIGCHHLIGSHQKHLLQPRICNKILKIAHTLRGVFICLKDQKSFPGKSHGILPFFFISKSNLIVWPFVPVRDFHDINPYYTNYTLYHTKVPFTISKSYESIFLKEFEILEKNALAEFFTFCRTLSAAFWAASFTASFTSSST